MVIRNHAAGVAGRTIGIFYSERKRNKSLNKKFAFSWNGKYINKHRYFFVLHRLGSREHRLKINITITAPSKTKQSQDGGAELQQ